MKARDVVPNWPRGRSTSGGKDESYWRALYLWCPVCISEREVLEAIDYHARQQAMVNAYFENWRLGKCVRLDETQKMVLGLLLFSGLPLWRQKFTEEPKSKTTYGLLA